MSILAPGWVPFVQRYVTLGLTSSGADVAATTIRSGEFGREIKNVEHAKDLDKFTIHFEIPAGWNDFDIVKYILSQLADNLDVHRLAKTWAVNKPELFKKIAEQRFKNGLTTVAALAKGDYAALAGLTIGGQVAVVAWDIQEGDNFAAALDAALLLPLGKFAQGVFAASGTIAVRAGDKLIAALPLKVIERLQKLAPEQKSLLRTRLLAAKTNQEAAEVIDKFLDTEFHAHHPLPMFPGGELEQLRSRIPKEIHEELHSILREELRNLGINKRIGGPGGSAGDWEKYFIEYKGSQGKAFNAVLTVSRAIDAKHGTNVTQWVWENILGKRFIFIP